jgi:hypothetical protein
MNPSVPQSYIDGHVAADPARAQAEYYAQFRTDVETFISREVVDAAVVPGRHDLPRMDGVIYTGFTDPSGGSSDPMTLSIAHVETDTAGTKRTITDLVREVKPPFSPDAVVVEFATSSLSLGLPFDPFGRPAPRRLPPPPTPLPWPPMILNSEAIILIFRNRACDKSKPRPSAQGQRQPRPPPRHRRGDQSKSRRRSRLTSRKSATLIVAV